MPHARKGIVSAAPGRPAPFPGTCGPMWRLLFVLSALPCPLIAQAKLIGHLRTSEGDVPLSQAEISLPTLKRSVLTRDDGSFSFPDLPAGAVRIIVRRIGYDPIDMVQLVPEKGTVRLELRMRALAMTLDSVTVTADSERHRIRMAEFERRRQMGIGVFLTRKKLVSRETMSLQTLLREFGISQVPPLRSRSNSFANACREMQLIVDGIRRPYRDLRTFTVRELEAIEIYTGTARVPIEFEWDRASCGVVVLWTRTG